MAFRQRAPKAAEQTVTLAAHQEEQIGQMADPGFLVRFITSIRFPEGSGRGPVSCRNFPMALLKNQGQQI
ncbi:hypothetical protein GF318_03335 [Candidatus Micrarchaeota archaeon]|nr:hypothetical protein [Candidatus Micrarchaeota archaeon]